MARQGKRRRIWRCHVCGKRLSLHSVWFDDEGPLCDRHGMVKRMEFKPWLPSMGPLLEDSHK